MKKVNPDIFIGKKYGVLTITGITKNAGSISGSIVHVKCECGQELDKPLKIVLASLKSCSRQCKLFGTDHAEKYVQDRYLNKRVGHLTVKSYIGFKNITYNSGATERRTIVRCECDCGRIIDIPMQLIAIEGMKSCGKCNLARCLHGENADLIGSRLSHIYTYITRHAVSLAKFEISDEWFNTNDYISSVQNFVNYCKPLYEKCMNDNSTKRVFIHRIDIDKPLGPGNVYFDHNQLNINYPGRVFY